MATGAQLIAKRLHEAGCKHAFGMPGGEVLALVDALGNLGIDFFLAKHETAAGFMAEGSYHATGTPGVLVTTLGPGVSNAVNVIVNAKQDRIPLICITGRIDLKEEHSYSHQIFDHQAIMRPISKRSLLAVHGNVDIVIDKAIALALSEPQGPVHLDLPISVAQSEQTPALLQHRSAAKPSVPVNDVALKEARNWLACAVRPLMIAGLEVLSRGAHRIVAEICQRMCIPLITTYKAKGVLSEDSPLSMGAAGLSPLVDQHLLTLVSEADTILLAGYDPIEMRDSWRNPWNRTQRVIDIRTFDDVHYMHSANHYFVGDIGESLTLLTKDLKSNDSWDQNIPMKIRERVANSFSSDTTFNPISIVRTARENLPRDTVATVDSGAHRILLSQVWHCFEPHTLLQSTGLCTMGCALPIATGYAISAPKRTVVAFVGDAGLEMVLGELATLRDSKCPIIVIVFVDRALALIELKQRNLGLANRAVEFGGTDFAKIAHSLNGEGFDANNCDELKAAILSGLRSDTFSVIACHLESRAYDNRI